MRFENDEVSELCRAVFIVGVDVMAATVDAAPTPGDPGGRGEYGGIGRASTRQTVTGAGRFRTQLAGDRCGGVGGDPRSPAVPRQDPYGSLNQSPDCSTSLSATLELYGSSVVCPIEPLSSTVVCG